MRSLAYVCAMGCPVSIPRWPLPMIVFSWTGQPEVMTWREQGAQTPAEVLRFFVVAVVGLLIDLAVGGALAVLAGVPLVVAGAAGFATGASFNYVIHELWTFRSGERRLSLARATKYAVTLTTTLLMRLGAIVILEALIGAPGRQIPILVLASGVSLVVNYVVSKFFIFTCPSAALAQPGMTDPGSVHSAAIEDADWEIPMHETEVFRAKAHRYALVIPVINEGNRIRNQLREIAAAAPGVDIVVADGGSTDGSLDRDFLQSVGLRALLTKTCAGKLSAQLRMAYGWCLREGYEGIVTMDGNGKDGVEAIDVFVDRLEKGFDYVQGSRYVPGGVAENTPLARTIGNRLIHAPLLSLSGRVWLNDTTNGFRAYSRRYLLDPQVKPFRNVFQSYELLFYLTARAGQTGMRVGKIPVTRRYPAGEATPTKINGAGAKWRILAQTIRAARGDFNPN